MANEDSEKFWLELLSTATKARATDIHFNDGRISFRVDTDLAVYADIPMPIYNQHVMYLANRDIAKAHIKGEVGAADFASTIGDTRLRVNIYRAIAGLTAAVRMLPKKSFDWQAIGLSQEVVNKINNSQQGLVLITGPTGSGKSSTVCSLIQMLNENYPYKIITIEDPIEYIFTRKRADISQREVGEHTDSFASALRSALREDPDVIFVGEIRDHETAFVALHAAETGHLVFSTLHTKRVYNTISTVIEMAPEARQPEIRSILAHNLLMVMCQRLMPATGGGITCCREVLMECPAAAACITSKKEKSLVNVMQSGRAQGMIDWNSALQNFVKEEIITPEVAKFFRDTSDDLQ